MIQRSYITPNSTTVQRSCIDAHNYDTILIWEKKYIALRVSMHLLLLMSRDAFDEAVPSEIVPATISKGTYSPFRLELLPPAVALTTSLRR
jgi:hypothetical protein